MRKRNTYLELGQYAHDLIRSKARSLVGTAGFTLDDCDDIEQELAMDLLGRGRNWGLGPVGAVQELALDLMGRTILARPRQNQRSCRGSDARYAMSPKALAAPKKTFKHRPRCGYLGL